ncbi:hypothetical protein ApDm4_1493 [Acetobacter pomorum]|nr:hypothetical protein CPF11_14120 [Acetobacter pomorum]KGB24335.1 hypothetical protein ApDm4_1493 [Acetobacter pomorum]
MKFIDTFDIKYHIFIFSLFISGIMKFNTENKIKFLLFISKDESNISINKIEIIRKINSNIDM